MSEKLTEEFLKVQDRFIDDFLGRPQCMLCARYKGKRKCEAFPFGIPSDLVTNGFIHSVTYPDQDNDLVFVAKEEGEEE